MTQNIFRIKKDKDNPYLMMNKEPLNNANLSWKAKGLLTYLLSLPDDWKIYEEEISKHAKDGKDSLKSAIKELITNGYIERERIRNSSGQLKGYAYCVYEVPNHNGKSIDGNSNDGESATTNNNYTNTNEIIMNNHNGTKSDDVRTLYTKEPFSEEVKIVVGYYFSIYLEDMGEAHPKLKKKQLDTVMTNITDFMSEYSMDVENMETMIDKHFSRTHLDTDYNINHFATEGILANLVFDAGLH